MQTSQIPNNKAVRVLMDDALMIGRHRPIVAKWFQNWVDEKFATITLKENATEQEVQEACEALKQAIASEVMDSITFTQSKVSKAPDWKPGRPYPKEHPIVIQIRGAIQTFRLMSKEEEAMSASHVSPKDSSTVLGRAPSQG